MDLKDYKFIHLLIATVLANVVSSLEQQTKLIAFYSSEVTSGHLVVPRKVTEEGNFLSHNLTHFHYQHYRQTHSRKRRNAPQLEEDNLHYQLELDNETLHLELKPHSYFMTPHLIVERHRRDLRTRKQPMNKHTNCHFHGKIRGQFDSKVAISTCSGLVGHIMTKNNQYYIEPSKQHKAHPTDGHPHVVYHSSAVKGKQYHTRKHKYFKRKHKFRHKLHSKEASISNCGTKEPHRHIETRLEWQPQGRFKIQGSRKVRKHSYQQQYHRYHTKHNQKHHQLYLQQQHQLQQHKPQDKFKYKSTENATVKENPRSNNQQQHKSTHSMSSNNSGNSNSNTIINLIKNNESSIESPANPNSMQSTSTANVSSIRPSMHRQKRSVSSPRHVEALLVADATMVAFHSENVETYLLTIMNMVSALYKDPSIGNSIEVVVVKIILLEEDEAHPDLNLTQNAQQNLNSFCSWQHHLNTINELDPHHHDVAILVTRKNICANNCMTLGLANVGGMCKPKQSCSVNEDNGIMLSHTIAHELGHNFGMFHDTAKIGCHPRVGSIVHIMTPTFGADTLQVCWSNCSRKYITSFLDQGLGDCLDDAPTQAEQYIYPDLPPGVLYNAELQCRLQFNLTDSEVATCVSMNEICSTLWCKVNDECVTNMRPTAPGTSCGKRKWCQNGKCVHMKDLMPINGGWGEWTEWSTCSRKCGGGISIQQRECNNPVPANGGVFCIGERKRYKICNKNHCSAGEPSFRAKQCTTFDNKPYQGALYKWQPFFDKANPCKLFCTDVDDTVIANWADVALDGTPCTLGTNNMCIDGICKKVGCDWEIDSDLQEDRCGICGGNGNKCKPVQQVVNETLNIAGGYIELVRIPARARHIKIQELINSPNFLAISNIRGDHFYLNGDSLISMSGEFIIAGAEASYDRSDEREAISIPQPIEHDIIIYLIMRDEKVDSNSSVFYEFTLPALHVSNGQQYLWKLGSWTDCSAECGGGLQYRQPLCYESGELLLTTELCWSHAENPRPLRKVRSCNITPCPAHWLAGPWQFCPATCKQTDTPLPIRRRSVMCLDQHDIVVDDRNCNITTRPLETEYCEQSLPDCISKQQQNNLVL